MKAVKTAGVMVLAQDEATSQSFGMPRSAIETGCVDRVLPLGQIGPALLELVSEPRLGRLDNAAVPDRR